MFRASVILQSLLLCLSTGMAASAADPPAASPAPATAEGIEFFEKRVRPLLARHCYECHSEETGSDNGELVLATAAGIRAGGSRGSLFDAKITARSPLLAILRYENPDLEMPPEGKLPPEAIAVFEEWIRRGAPLPADTAVAPKRGPDLDWQTARDFWSFRPLADGPVPDVTDAARIRRPIDRFIQQRLEQEGLAPNPEADRRTLIRRVTFDLTGLPPTPDEVAAFLNDEAPDAYERLVERLLDSPHYGERWSRVWLDLARYTDTTASWLKSTGDAWRYRDWVTRAFNRNLPYDRFLRLQLAADLIDDAEVSDLAALGFLGLSPTYWKELRLAPAVIEQVVAEEWDERIDAVSRTFLGLTVACARCHDHKFDPITMRDYYGLAGVFASTQLDDRPLLPDADARVVQQARTQVEKLEADLAKIKDKESEPARTLTEQIAEIKQNTPHYDAPWVNIVREAAVYVRPDGDDATRLEYRDNEPRDIPIYRRGNPSNPGDVVPRRFLTVLSPDEPAPFSQGSGRRELAESLLTDGRALTARVFVNRIWLEHFGAGLVRTPSNFGVQGERPTHPELLDWLAAEFIRRGWDVHWLHREIVLSATYRQSSAVSEEARGRDPDNRLLGRMSRRRLTVEMWRDAMLATAGTLDATVGGPAVPIDDPGNRRRTLYAKIARRELDQMLRLYDFPEPTAHSPRREPTTTPLQQLYVLNAPFLEQQATALAGALPADVETAEQIAFAYERLFARPPTEAETAVGQTFLTAAGAPDAARWRDYLHALFGLNEFLYVD